MSPLLLPKILIDYVDCQIDELRAVTNQTFPGLKGKLLLQQRAELMGFQSQSLQSANGSCHLFLTRDQQWIALNLSRASDWELLPALFQSPFVPSQESQFTRETIAQEIKQHHAPALLSQGRVLGLAIALASVDQDSAPASPCRVVTRGAVRKTNSASPRVLDLSSLWAGPLCSHLLQQCGARVIQVESQQRPDGARLNTLPGAQAFYQLLHQKKELCSLDFQSEAALSRLKQLLSEADIVIESSRPRALRQLGIQAEHFVASQPGKIWISITGYGRSEPEAQWIAYGDDAAVQGGLVEWRDDQPLFIGDAVADPLTGLQAALQAWKHHQRGEAVLLDVNLHQIARNAAQHMKRVSHVAF